MTDPAALTAVIGATAGVIGAGTPIIIERRNRRNARKEREQDTVEDTVASWASLNKALGEEIDRLHSDIDRIRADYHAAMNQQRAEYEEHLDVARKRISELETDVASLRRLLGQPPK